VPVSWRHSVKAQNVLNTEYDAVHKRTTVLTFNYSILRSVLLKWNYALSMATYVT